MSAPDEAFDVSMQNDFDWDRFAKQVNVWIDFFFNVISSIVGNIASNVAPLTAGLLPAYLTFIHIDETLGYDTWVAWAGAITIEFLGLGSGNELMKIWYHNKYIAKEPEEKLPMLNAGMSAGWYVAIMVVFNVIMEKYPTSLEWRIVAIALFATLAVPGYMLVSGRTLRIQMEQNAERIAYELAEETRIAVENQLAAERYAIEQADNSARELARINAENERLQKAAEFSAQLEVQRMKHQHKMERIAVELELERERTNRVANEQRTNDERTNSERTNGVRQKTASERTVNESMTEIFQIMDRLFIENNHKLPSQSDICREVSRQRNNGSPENYEAYKSYVNKAVRQWSPPEVEQVQSIRSGNV